MENKKFNKEKFFTELFDNKQVQEITNKYNLNNDKTFLTNFFNEKYYKKEANKDFFTYRKRYVNEKDNLFNFKSFASINAVIFGFKMGIVETLTASFVLEAAISATIATYTLPTIMATLSKIKNNFSNHFNNEQKYIKSVENIALNNLKEEFKNYSINDLKNISYLKPYELDKVENLEQLKGKIKNINNFINDKYVNDYKTKDEIANNHFLIKNTLDILNQKIQEQENSQKVSFIKNICGSVNITFKKGLAGLGLVSAAVLGLNAINTQGAVLNNLIPEAKAESMIPNEWQTNRNAEQDFKNLKNMFSNDKSTENKEIQENKSKNKISKIKNQKNKNQISKENTENENSGFWNKIKDIGKSTVKLTGKGISAVGKGIQNISGGENKAENKNTKGMNL